MVDFHAAIGCGVENEMAGREAILRPPSAQAGFAKADCLLLTGREKNEVAPSGSKRSAIL